MQQLLRQLSERNVKLSVNEQGQLLVSAPAGVMTNELAASIREHKAALVESLQRELTVERTTPENLPRITPDAAGRYLPFPLNVVQHAYWIGRNSYMYLGGVATHFYFELECQDLDLARLAQAFNKVVLTHDMLRAVIDAEGSQRVLQEVPTYRIQNADLRDLAGAASTAMVQGIRAEMAQQVFDCERWPLFEIRSAQLDAHTTRLFLSWDFLVVDAWSMLTIFREWRCFYDQPALEPQVNALSFRDYVLAEIQLRDTPIYDQARQYWWERLDRLPLAPLLPIRGKAELGKKYQFTRRRATLTREKWQQLRAIAQGHAITPSNLLLAAYSETLTRWSRSPHYCLNLTLFNRLPLHANVMDLVGDFTTLTITEIGSERKTEFVARARAIQDRFLQDFEHRQVSAIEVLREIVKRRRLGQGVLLPVVFTSTLMLSSKEGEQDGRGLEQFGTMCYGITQTPQVWLDCQIFEVDGELIINWDAAEDIFVPGVLDAMFASQMQLLETLLSPPAWHCDHLVPLVPEQDAVRVADHRSLHTSLLNDAEELLHTAFLQQALSKPGQVALADGDIAISYGELHAHSSLIAQQLVNRGVRCNELVAVMMDKGWQQVASVLGILIAGAAYLPIDPALPVSRRELLLSSGEVRWVLVCEGQTSLLTGATEVGVIEIARQPAWRQPTTLPLPRQTQQDIAYVIFTSGSSGVPKGVVIPHRGALNTIKAMNQMFGVSSADRVLAVSSLSFDLSVYDVFGTLAAGGTIVMPPARASKDPTCWSELIDRFGVTVWNSAPQLMGMLVEYVESSAKSLSSLRMVWMSGDWIPPKLPARIKALTTACQVISLGGATECSIWSNYYPITTDTSSLDSVPYGKALPGQTIMVLDRQLQPCPDHVVGDIYIGGEGVALGYWKDRERTDRQFIVHPRTQERLYWTGDLGRYFSDGTIEFLGREDEQIKLHGHRVELGEIAAQIKAFPHVADSAVHVTEQDGVQSLIACVVPARDTSSALIETLELSEQQHDELLQALVQVDDVAVSERELEDLRYFNEFWACMTRACLAAMHETLQRLDAAGDGDLQQALVRAGVPKRYQFLVDKWRSLLQEPSWIRLSRAGESRSNDDRVVTLPDARAELEARFALDPRVAGFQQYIQACLSQQWSLLFGQVSPLELLFPAGSIELAANIYQTNPVAIHHNTQLVALLRAVLQRRAGAGLRVLEIGAGTGATTQVVLPLLEHTSSEYWFTDVSTFFLEHARREFARFDFVHYDVFNIDDEVRDQVYQAHSFDVIIGANVLHDAKHLGQSVDRLRQLLAPGGHLLLIEGTQDSPWQWVSVAYLEGVGDYRDERALTKSPVLSTSSWRDVLVTNGFGHVDFYPRHSDREATRWLQAAMPQHVVVAQGPRQVTRFNPEPLSAHLKALLPSYMVPQVYVEMVRLPLSSNGKVDRSALPNHRRMLQQRPRALQPARTSTEQLVLSVWKQVLRLDAISVDDSFFDLGGDSLLLTQVLGKINQAQPVRLNMADLFSYPTIRSLSSYIGQADRVAKPASAAVPVSASAKHRATGDIAVIGMSGRFPDASNVDAFWDNLRRGVCSVRQWSDDTLRSAGLDAQLLANPRYVKAGILIEHIDLFDAGYFGVTPREAQIIDPQIRLLLEEAVTAMEHAGYPHERYGGAVGVFVGKDVSQYLYAHLFGRHDLLESMGTMAVANVNEKDYAATQISYKMGFTGPSLNINTACSTSLVAVHQACQSLLAGECNVALAGGVSLETIQPAGYLHRDGSIASRDGYCRAFSDDASGCVRGSGVGLVVLKPLEQAQADRDTIHAVIKATAINNDGSLKIGYTAPSVQGQAKVIATALAKAGLSASQIQYVEAHGTGTALGDPVETRALAQVFNRQSEAHCAIGSVKTNIGHLDAAAGVAGLIKTVQALKHGEIPPSLNFRALNPSIDTGNGGLFVNHTLRAWPGGVPRRAGVSSFGVGGTNAHAVLEEAPPSAARKLSAGDDWHLVIMSARSPKALQSMNQALSQWVAEQPGIAIGDLAYTLQVGRNAHDYRQAAVCKSLGELRAVLEAGPCISTIDSGQITSVVFMFPGQGAQRLASTWQLYQRHSVFRRSIDECAKLLSLYLGRDIRAILYPEYAAQIGVAAADAIELQQTSLAQPLLFAVEYSLAQLWLSLGIRPEAMLGHSIGEYVAACMADVFRLEEVLSLVVVRGQLMQSLPPGQMLAVGAGEERLAPLLKGTGCEIATLNGPAQTVVSGTEQSIAQLGEQLSELGIVNTLLKTSHAFHSRAMEPILETFEACVREVERRPVRIPFISNVTGTWITNPEAMDPHYWARHLREAVRFSAGLACLAEQKNRVYVEVGPGSVLSALAKANHVAAERVIPTLGYASKPVDESLELHNSLAQLWLRGVDEIDWLALHAECTPGRIPLPTYAFERQSYWIPPLKSPATVAFDVVESPAAATAPAVPPLDEPQRFQRPTLKTPYVAPGSELQARLAALWQSHLGIENIGINDNFFELGGNSLIGIQVNERMRQDLQMDIPVDKLFQLSTIRNITNYHQILTEQLPVSALSHDEIDDILSVYES